MKIPTIARALFALALTALSVSPALADPQHLPAPVAAKQQPLAANEAPPVKVLHPALWEVHDADTTIYLFGTIHVLKPGLDWFNGPIKKALDSSDELVTEIADPTGAGTRAALLERATLPKGETLRGIMGAKQRATYEALLKKIGLPAVALDRYKPWYAAVVLSSLPLVKQGLDPKSGAEALLDKEATEEGKPHDALETVDYQLGLFDSLSRETQLKYLATVVSEYGDVVSEIDGLVSAWGKGDAKGLAKMMNADMDDPSMTQRLLIDRNHNWAEWIRKRMAKPGTVFIAVGAGHLAGKGSVLDQLCALGIASKRVQ